jgi:hypothetical protein
MFDLPSRSDSPQNFQINRRHFLDVVVRGGITIGFAHALMRNSLGATLLENAANVDVATRIGACTREAYGTNPEARRAYERATALTVIMNKLTRPTSTPAEERAKWQEVRDLIPGLKPELGNDAFESMLFATTGMNSKMLEDKENFDLVLGLAMTVSGHFIPGASVALDAATLAQDSRIRGRLDPSANPRNPDIGIPDRERIAFLQSIVLTEANRLLNEHPEYASFFEDPAFVARFGSLTSMQIKSGTSPSASVEKKAIEQLKEQIKDASEADEKDSTKGDTSKTGTLYKATKNAEDARNKYLALVKQGVSTREHALAQTAAYLEFEEALRAFRGIGSFGNAFATHVLNNPVAGRAIESMFAVAEQTTRLISLFSQSQIPVSQLLFSTAGGMGAIIGAFGAVMGNSGLSQRMYKEMMGLINEGFTAVRKDIQDTKLTILSRIDQMEITFLSALGRAVEDIKEGQQVLLNELRRGHVLVDTLLDYGINGDRETANLAFKNLQTTVTTFVHKRSTALSELERRDISTAIRGFIDYSCDVAASQGFTRADLTPKWDPEKVADAVQRARSWEDVVAVVNSILKKWGDPSAFQSGGQPSNWFGGLPLVNLSHWCRGVDALAETLAIFPDQCHPGLIPLISQLDRTVKNTNRALGEMQVRLWPVKDGSGVDMGGQKVLGTGVFKLVVDMERSIREQCQASGKALFNEAESVDHVQLITPGVYPVGRRLPPYVSGVWGIDPYQVQSDSYIEHVFRPDGVRCVEGFFSEGIDPFVYAQETGLIQVTPRGAPQNFYYPEGGKVEYQPLEVWLMRGDKPETQITQATGPGLARCKIYGKRFAGFNDFGTGLYYNSTDLQEKMEKLAEGRTGMQIEPDHLEEHHRTIASNVMWVLSPLKFEIDSVSKLQQYLQNEITRRHHYAWCDLPRRFGSAVQSSDWFKDYRGMCAALRLVMAIRLGLKNVPHSVTTAILHDEGMFLGGMTNDSGTRNFRSALSERIATRFESAGIRISDVPTFSFNDSQPSTALKVGVAIQEIFHEIYQIVGLDIKNVTALDDERADNLPYAKAYRRLRAVIRMYPDKFPNPSKK